MTPHEKAKKLFGYHYYYLKNDRYACMQCAIITVDEMIDMLMTMSEYMLFPQQVKYWQDVKQELEKLL
jgi:hypothetical protein